MSANTFAKLDTEQTKKWDEQIARAKVLLRTIEDSQWEFAQLCAEITDAHGYGSKKALGEELGYTPAHISRVVKTWHLFGENRFEGESYNAHMEYARVVNRKDREQVMDALRERKSDRSKKARRVHSAASRSAVEELVDEAAEATAPRTPAAVRALRERISNLRRAYEDDVEEDRLDLDLRRTLAQSLEIAIRDLRDLQVDIRRD